MDRLRAGALLTIGLVAACTSPVASPPLASPPPPSPTYAAPSLDIEQPGRTASTGQTDTDWGPIWDKVPAKFPVPPLAEPAAADAGPVSAAFAIKRSGTRDPRAVAQFYTEAFSHAGYGGARDGPLEDGSYTAWASDGYGCDILVRAVPRGDREILATVLYGAGCPFSWLAAE